MKYIWRFIQFIYYCLRSYLFLPVLFVLVNILGVIWHFGIPNGWFKLESHDFYWEIDNKTERSIRILRGQQLRRYNNPWHLLINKITYY